MATLAHTTNADRKKSTRRAMFTRRCRAARARLQLALGWPEA